MDFILIDSEMIIISLVLILYFYPRHSVPAYSSPSPSLQCAGKFLRSTNKMDIAIFREDSKII